MILLAMAKAVGIYMFVVWGGQCGAEQYSCSDERRMHFVGKCGPRAGFSNSNSQLDGGSMSGRTGLGVHEAN